MDEGLLDDPLTLADIRKLAASFRFTLLNMLQRIAYPKDELNSMQNQRARPVRGPSPEQAAASSFCTRGMVL